MSCGPYMDPLEMSRYGGAAEDTSDSCMRISGFLMKACLAFEP